MNVCFLKNISVLDIFKRISLTLYWNLKLQIRYTSILQDVCRRVLCPLFHVRKGHTCQSTYTNFADQPKLAIIQFHELNKTIKLQDPYKNFENDTLDLVEDNILVTVLFPQETFKPFYTIPWLSMHGLYYNFYQRQGINESDFILETAWLSGMDEELVPDSFKRFFDTVNVSIPILHTSTLFEARLITNYDIHSENFTINQSTYTRIFRRRFLNSFAPKLYTVTRYLQMSPLVICNRVSVPLSALTITDESFYHHSSDVGVALPDHYITTENYIEMCADDYFHLTSHALKSSTEKRGNLYDIFDEIAKILSFVCSCISIVCLIITIAVYSLFESLRTTPGKINLCLCISLLIAQILQQFTIDLIEYKIACNVFGVLIHFSWSATLCWMSVSSFNLFRSFSPSNIRADLRQSIGPYATFVVIMSSLLVVANMSHSLVHEGNFGYGKGICYISSRLGLLVTFVTPVGVIVLSNMCFLSVTIWRISHIPKLTGTKSADRNNVLIYTKMSTLTGACWIFGFLGILTELDVFEILFILANASQGLFLMISFVCNKRVLTLFKELLSR